MEENRKGRGTIGRAAVERSRAGLVQSTVAAVTRGYRRQQSTGGGILTPMS